MRDIVTAGPGDRFGKWTVEATEIVFYRGQRRVRCRIVCDCGKRGQNWVQALRCGQSRSCGCGRREFIRQKMKTHGLSHTHTHRCWSHMRQRCNNPNSSSYADYGGRGIKICERWGDYLLFVADLGEAPSIKHSLDRIDVNGDYELGNVRWATNHEQSRNRRNTIYAEINGKRMCLKDAATARGFKYATVRDRIQRYGWTVEQALNTPVISKSALSRDDCQRFAPSPKAKWFGPAFPTRT